MKVSGKIAFRVHYDNDNEFSRAIIKLLPKAFETGRSLLGVEVYRTGVFIFATAERLQAFYSVRAPSATPASWYWAMGTTGIMIFSEANPRGDNIVRHIGSDYFTGAIAHEYTHSILRRVLGTLAIPRWLDEGVAMYAGSRIGPSNLKVNDQSMRAQMDAGAVLALDQLESSADFNARVEDEYRIRSANSEGAIRPRPYDQAFHMVRYLLTRGSANDLRRFLGQYAATGDFEASFQHIYGLTKDKFYEEWIKYGLDKVSPLVTVAKPTAP